MKRIMIDECYEIIASNNKNIFKDIYADYFKKMQKYSGVSGKHGIHQYNATMRILNNARLMALIKCGGFHTVGALSYPKNRHNIPLARRYLIEILDWILAGQEIAKEKGL